MAAIQRHGGWKSAQVAQGYVDGSDTLKNSTAQQISKNINLPTMEKMPNVLLTQKKRRTMSILISKNPKLKRKNPKLNENPKNIIISKTVLSTLKNLIKLYFQL